MSLHDTVFYDEWALDILFLTISHASQAIHLQAMPYSLNATLPVPSGIFLPVFAGDDEGGRNQLIPQYQKLPLAKALAHGQGQ